MIKLNAKRLKRLIYGALDTPPHEIGCDDCFAVLDRYAELYLLGKDVAEAMPLVHDHLQRCTACREEFEALLAALQALEDETG
jgi:predicted anti-sigma-YlaC factor YlaD